MAVVEASEVAAELSAHERECALRYEHIQERLKSGEQRFNRLEAMIWGIYVILIGSSVIPQLIN
tara:strand:- start:1552 stop:1743 length:192 start_codon:yes stop_codon:yes gene_type:complete